MLGKPIYKYGQKVSFLCGDRRITGLVEIIDAYGTFGQSEEVSYDVFSESENCLYKHLCESLLTPEDD